MKFSILHQNLNMEGLEKNTTWKVDGIFQMQSL
jgi:hypothetical protein